MFIELLSICTVVVLADHLQSNYKEPIKCVTLNNRPCQARPTLCNIDSNVTLFYPFISCNFIDDLSTRICVPFKLKDINVKVFNLM